MSWICRLFPDAPLRDSSLTYSNPSGPYLISNSAVPQSKSAEDCGWLDGAGRAIRRGVAVGVEPRLCESAESVQVSRHEKLPHLGKADLNGMRVSIRAGWQGCSTRRGSWSSSDYNGSVEP